MRPVGVECSFAVATETYNTIVPFGLKQRSLWKKHEIIKLLFQLNNVFFVGQKNTIQIS